MRFADCYRDQLHSLIQHPVDMECRGMNMAYEKLNVTMRCEVNCNAMSIFSYRQHRVVPMRFVLAELCHMLAGRNDVESIASYNSAMRHYADHDGTMNGAYGYRLRTQWQTMIDRLMKDRNTRQACVAIYSEKDGSDQIQTHLPCNIFLQLFLRGETLSLTVISRSSDFVTGFSIDTLHWQALLIMMRNELVKKYDIQRMELVYQIGSLHIYKSDVELVHQWIANAHMIQHEHEHEHFIVLLTISLSEALVRAKKMFKANLSVIELGNILCLDFISLNKAIELEALFVAFKNKLVR